MQARFGAAEVDTGSGGNSDDLGNGATLFGLAVAPEQCAACAGAAEGQYGLFGLSQQIGKMGGVGGVDGRGGYGLKKIVAELSLDNEMLKDIASKNF